MKFKYAAVLNSLLLFTLAFGWVFYPENMLSQWSVEYSSSAGIMSRRGAAFYLGIAVMFFIVRNVSSSTGRSAIILGSITTYVTLASFALYEFVEGHASGNILIAGVIEFLLALTLLLCFEHKDRRKTSVTRE